MRPLMQGLRGTHGRSQKAKDIAVHCMLLYIACNNARTTLVNLRVSMCDSICVSLYDGARGSNRFALAWGLTSGLSIHVLITIPFCIGIDLPTSVAITHCVSTNITFGAETIPLCICNGSFACRDCLPETTAHPIPLLCTPHSVCLKGIPPPPTTEKHRVMGHERECASIANVVHVQYGGGIRQGDPRAKISGCGITAVPLKGTTQDS